MTISYPVLANNFTLNVCSEGNLVVLILANRPNSAKMLHFSSGTTLFVNIPVYWSHVIK